MPFLVGVDAENIYKALQLRDDVSPFHSQLQGVILQFVEVHQLVHQTEHAPHTALYDVKQLFVFSLYFWDFRKVVLPDPKSW